MPVPRDETAWTPVAGDHADDPSYIRTPLAPTETPTDEVLTEEELDATAEALDAEVEEGEVNATSVAIERAAELGVDLATVTGTGVGGKITKADVEAAKEG
jgi:pyruvate/2-oxoglutarate dehydrogenase complex dihydrolipoamide acyltransferase (E2) component